MISGQPCIFPFFFNGLKYVGCQHRDMLYKNIIDKVCLSYLSLYYGLSEKRIVVVSQTLRVSFLPLGLDLCDGSG